MSETWTWRKSRRSVDNGQCVEVARPEAPVVAVRDSKNPAAGHLTFRAGAFDAFMKGISND
jgi:hypothetical protein